MIDLSLVKKLREEASSGISDCKKALEESNGNYEEAVVWLRKKGIANAAKKASRVASEGLVGTMISGKTGVTIEVNSETDFVAKNEGFQSVVNSVLKNAVSSQTFEELESKTLEAITTATATIGEKISLRRFAKITVSSGAVISYIHNSVAPSLGKLAVLIGMESNASEAHITQLGKQIAMHIAAANPKYLSVSQVDSTHLESEREIFREQASASGKPADVVEKMVLGRINKFFEETVLLNQAFVIDPKKKIADLLEDFKKQHGSEIKITEFVLFRLGEGIEKVETDFAKEVAEVAGLLS